MKTTFFTRLFAGSLITAALFTACSKNETIDELNNGPQQTTAITNLATAENPYILNQDLKVSYARDGGIDITEQLNDWTFRFNGNSPSGEAQAWNDILSRTGTWSMPAGASSISISYPTDISQLAFMSRDWTIGTPNRGSEIVLTAADGDEVHLISKTQ